MPARYGHGDFDRVDAPSTAAPSHPIAAGEAGDEVGPRVPARPLPCQAHLVRALNGLGLTDSSVFLAYDPAPPLLESESEHEHLDQPQTTHSDRERHPIAHGQPSYPMDPQYTFDTVESVPNWAHTGGGDGYRSSASRWSTFGLGF